MVVGDGGQFLEKCALELAEFFKAYYHYPYASPHKTDCPMEALFSRYGQNNFFPMFVSIM